MTDDNYWGEERRHCNRMISVIFFGSLSSVAIIVEFLDSVPLATFVLTVGILSGSAVWILMYAKWREDVIKNDVAMVRDGRWWWSFRKVYLFPGCYLVLASLVGFLAFAK